MLGLILAGLAGLFGAIFSLSYKFRTQRGYPIGPVMLVFSFFYALVAAIAAFVLDEPLITPKAALLGDIRAAGQHIHTALLPGSDNTPALSGF